MDRTCYNLIRKHDTTRQLQVCIYINVRFAFNMKKASLLQISFVNVVLTFTIQSRSSYIYNGLLFVIVRIVLDSKQQT